MMTISQIKSFAKRQLKGNLLSAIGAMLLSSICFSLWASVFFTVILVGIIGPVTGRLQLINIGSNPETRLLFFAILGIVIAALLFLGVYICVGLMLGTQMFYLDMVKGKRVGAFYIFRGFSDNAHLRHYLGVVLILYLVEFILMIPMSLVGLNSGYKSMDYELTKLITSFVSFIITLFLGFSTYASADNKDMKALDALKVSFHLMRARKFKLILFELSFFLWFLLVMITCGIAAFWVIPYFYAAYSVFYLSAYSQDFKRKEESEEPEETEEPKDTYVRGDAVPEKEEPERSFEEVRRQYTEVDSDAEKDIDSSAVTSGSDNIKADTEKNNYKSEEDGFAAYEKWKKDHGISIDNPDPFHGKYSGSNVKSQDSDNSTKE
ncbi:DUF975 family protein [Oribacterium sp. P6A1]|uniref:DUF975 family protein n=1 Tax=Oribacterium sp. P6A1 TaxID=1410612 RepID=UPI000559FDD9|nr:DUF975 family protein [Oribacterium sp. P6A1]